MTNCQTEKRMCESKRSEKNCNRELLSETLDMKLISCERTLKFTQTDQFIVHWSQEPHLDSSQRCVVPNYSISRASPSYGYYLSNQELRAGSSGFSKETHAKGRGYYTLISLLIQTLKKSNNELL